MINIKKISILTITTIYLAYVFYILPPSYINNLNIEIVVSFLDVGQGDCILIQSPEGKNMLIDAGSPESVATIIEFLKSKNIKKIDVLIATHPHDDHIGGMSEVIRVFDIGDMYMSKSISTTKAYLTLTKEIKKKKLVTKDAVSGALIEFDSELTTKILAPNSPKYDNMNNYSIIIKIIYKNISFLFTGDAQIESEKEVLDKGVDIRANVLKIGHHGSYDATSSQFLNAVSPQIAIISVGENNKYNLPSPVTLEKISYINAILYRTDLDKTIILKSDGFNLIN